MALQGGPRRWYAPRVILVDGAVARLRLESALERYAAQQGWRLAELAPGGAAALEAERHVPGAPPPRCIAAFATERSTALAASPDLDEYALAWFLRASLRCPVAVGLSATTPGVEDLMDADGALPGDFIVHQSWGEPAPQFEGSASGWLSDGASSAWQFIPPPPVPLEPRQHRALVAAWESARPGAFEALEVRLATAARAGDALAVELEVPALGVFPLWLEPCPRGREAQARALVELAIERLEHHARRLPEQWTPAPPAVLARLRAGAGLQHVTGLARAGLPAFTPDSTRRFRVDSSLGSPQELLLQGLDWLTDEAGFVATVQAALRSRDLTSPALEARAATTSLEDQLDAAIAAGDAQEAARRYLELHREYYEPFDAADAEAMARAKVKELIELERQRRARLGRA